MKDYEIVVGLEVHAELNTKSKIYCNCRNAFGLEVNSQVCPVCMGMPGTLPTLNEKVVEYAIKMGHAMHCQINGVCKQDRKNYFYPDLPKAYQISQAEVPLCGKGYLDVMVDGEMKRIGVTRIHIEEDAGKLLHDEAFAGSLVDLNRCGVPLIEIVSEPDIRSSAEAKAYLETIKSILQYLNISDCKMQEGSIRCDVNVSVREKGAAEFGTRCEMKNVNSFSAAVRGIEYEAKRQIEILEAGGTIAQETRRWDDAKGMSIVMRSKEDAQDYRYFPEPDLVPVVISDEWIERVKARQPEMRDEKLIRYQDEFGLPKYDAEILTGDKSFADLFEAAAAICGKPKKVSNWIMTETIRLLKENEMDPDQIRFSPEHLAKLVDLADAGSVTNTVAKEVFEKVFKEDIDPEAYVKEKGLLTVNDEGALRETVAKVVAENPQSVEDYHNGKEKAIGFLVGQTMRAMKGKANPALVNQILKELL
mgnify:CR=1 FL=1